MTKETTPATLLRWVLLGLFAHAGWGAYPVFSRYLQTVSRVPSMSLLAMGNLVVLTILIVPILRRLDGRVLRQPTLWFFGGIVILRGVTNLLAARFTLSIYVQLINQLTPFLVALLSAGLLRETLPRYTGRALTLCLGGALLMMSGNLIQLDGLTATPGDWLGIGLAAVSSLALATYMILVRRSASQQIPGEALLLAHLTGLFTFSLLASLILGEEWARWTQLETADWLVFAAFSVGVLLLSNVSQIKAIRELGAPLMSSMLASRLISALVVGALLLNERLTSGWQLLGTAVVLVTITWYLRQQNEHARA